jgi:hypothetical protein
MIKNSHYIFCLFFISFIFCQAQKNEGQAINKVFEKYKSAILNDKGEEAASYVDSRTIQYYSDILNLVKTADSSKVDSLTILDKLMVLAIRHRTSKADLLSFDGRKLLIYAINSGMVGKNSIADNTLGEVVIDKAFARAQIRNKGKTSPIYFHFYKEENNWKLDLTSIFSTSSVAFTKMISESGQSENAYLLYLLEIVSGKKPTKEIWEKVE